MGRRPKAPGGSFDAGESAPSSYLDLAGEPGLEKEEFPTRD